MIKKYGKFTFLCQFVSFKEFIQYCFNPKKWHLVKREFVFFFQRLNRGFDDSETWNLDSEIAEFVYPRLKRYFEITNMSPPCINDGNGEFIELSEEEWKEIEQKILFALDEIRLYGRDPYEFNKDWKKIKEGLDLFHKYMNKFWW